MKAVRIYLIGLMLLVFTALPAQAQVDEPLIELTLQLGHSDIMNSVAFSPDGKYAFSGSDGMNHSRT